MSKWEDVHIRQRVELTITQIGKKYNFSNMIVRKNDTAIFFQMPASPQSAAMIRKGNPCHVSITLENGTLIFSGMIDGIQPGTPPVVQINRPPDDQIHERPAAAAGLNVNLPVTYRIMRDHTTPISDMKKGETLSISAEDASILTNNELKAGSFIELGITLPKDTNPISLVGIIKDCIEVKDGMQVSYNSYVKYDVIRPGDQDKLVKHVFDQQRIMRKRGMY